MKAHEEDSTLEQNPISDRDAIIQLNDNFRNAMVVIGGLNDSMRILADRCDQLETKHGQKQVDVI